MWSTDIQNLWLTGHSVELFVPMTWPLSEGDDETEEIDSNMTNVHRKYKLLLMKPGILEAALDVILKPLSIPFKYVYLCLPQSCFLFSNISHIENELSEIM